MLTISNSFDTIEELRAALVEFARHYSKWFIDTVVCLTLANRETASGQFGGCLTWLEQVLGGTSPRWNEPRWNESWLRLSQLSQNGPQDKNARE